MASMIMITQHGNLLSLLLTLFLLPSLKYPHSLHGGTALNSELRTEQDTGRAFLEEAFSDGKDPSSPSGNQGRGLLLINPMKWFQHASSIFRCADRAYGQGAEVWRIFLLPHVQRFLEDQRNPRGLQSLQKWRRVNSFFLKQFLNSKQDPDL